jgi:hypothetical protein
MFEPLDRHLAGGVRLACRGLQSHEHLRARWSVE